MDATAEARRNAPYRSLVNAASETAGKSSLELGRGEPSRVLTTKAFTLADFKAQMGQIRKLGPFVRIMRMIPGMGKVADMMGGDIDPEEDLKQIEGIIDSMTPQERENPDIIDIGRRRSNRGRERARSGGRR